MSDDDKATKPARLTRIETQREDVLQVERRDYPELAPTDRPRSQSLDGFDDIYTDIVDYIVRCTHKIWDERDIGLIYTHYTHNCVLYGTMGTNLQSRGCGARHHPAPRFVPRAARHGNPGDLERQ